MLQQESYPVERVNQIQSMVSRQAVVNSACLGKKRSGTVSAVEKWLAVQNDSALTTPQPLGPLAAKHIHLPAREERQENQWLHTQLYHNLPSKRSLCFLWRRYNTTLYLHNACSSLLRFTLWDLSYFVIHYKQNNSNLTKKGSLE